MIITELINKKSEFDFQNTQLPFWTLTFHQIPEENIPAEAPAAPCEKI